MSAVSVTFNATSVEQLHADMLAMLGAKMRVDVTTTPKMDEQRDTGCNAPADVKEPEQPTAEVVDRKSVV